MIGKLTTQYCSGVIMQKWISFAVESWNSLKTRMLDKSTKEKEDKMCKISIKKDDLKQDDILRVLNVSQSVISRPLKEHRVSVLEKGNRLYIDSWEQGIATEALWYKCTWCIIWWPHDTVKSGYWDQDQTLEYDVRPTLDSLDGQNMVLRNDIARPHFPRIIEELKKQQNISSLPWPSLLSGLNPIEHVWDKLSWHVETGNQPYQNHFEFC